VQQIDPRLPGDDGQPSVAEEEPGSVASEWERREREEFLTQVGGVGERLGAETGE